MSSEKVLLHFNLKFIVYRSLFPLPFCLHLLGHKTSHLSPTFQSCHIALPVVYAPVQAAHAYFIGGDLERWEAAHRNAELQLRAVREGKIIAI